MLFRSRARELGVLDRVLLGSGFPHHTPMDAARAVMQCRDLTRAAGLPMLAHDLLKNLVHRDALALLGLHVSPPALPATPTEGKTS